MKNNAQLNEIQFSSALRETETYKNFPNFKQSIVIRRPNIVRLHGYYQQAAKFGIDYLKQNQNLTITDVALINDVINGQ